MSLSHSDALIRVAASVVTVALESVSSSFSAMTVVGIETNFAMEDVEYVASSFADVYLLLFFCFCSHFASTF